MRRNIHNGSILSAIILLNLAGCVNAADPQGFKFLGGGVVSALVAIATKEAK